MNKISLPKIHDTDGYENMFYNYDHKIMLSDTFIEASIYYSQKIRILEYYYNTNFRLQIEKLNTLYLDRVKEMEIKTIMETYNLDQEEAEVMYVLGTRYYEKDLNKILRSSNDHT